MLWWATFRIESTWAVTLTETSGFLSSLSVFLITEASISSIMDQVSIASS